MKSLLGFWGFENGPNGPNGIIIIFIKNIRSERKFKYSQSIINESAKNTMNEKENCGLDLA